MQRNQKLLEYVRRKEYKRRLEEHEIWGHVGGRIYSVAKILYTIFFLAVELLNVTYIAFSGSRLASHAQTPLENFGETRNALIVVVFGAVLLIAGYVLLAKRRPIGYVSCNAIASALLLLHYYNDMRTITEANGVQDYLYRYGLWYAALMLCILILALIQLRENAKEKKAYAKLEADLYARASKASDVPFTEADWEQLLEEYDGTSDKPMSRSEKTRAKKEAEENAEDSL